MGPSAVDWEIMTRLALAAVLGGLVGLEREIRERAAGLRTYMLVSIGAALFGSLSVTGIRLVTGESDGGRIAAQVVSGIGFLGAGIIFRNSGRVRGVTTAAGIWAMAAIGLTAGVGLGWIAVFATLLILLVLAVLSRVEDVALVPMMRRAARRKARAHSQSRHGRAISIDEEAT